MIDQIIWIILMLLCLATLGTICFYRGYWQGFDRGMDAAERNNFERTVAKSRTRAHWVHSRN